MLPERRELEAAAREPACTVGEPDGDDVAAREIERRECDRADERELERQAGVLILRIVISWSMYIEPTVSGVTSARRSGLNPPAEATEPS